MKLRNRVGLFLATVLATLLTTAEAYNSRYTDKRLDANLWLSDDGIVLRHRQSFTASDCRVGLNGRYYAVKLRVRSGENLLPWSVFRTLNDEPYDPSVEAVDDVMVQCLRPTLRVRRYRLP